MSLNMRRQEEATRTFSALRAAHSDIERATARVFTEGVYRLPAQAFGSRVRPVHGRGSVDPVRKRVVGAGCGWVRGFWR